VSQRMDPPFLARWQAVLCATGLIGLLALPVPLSSFGLVSRSDLYLTAPAKWGGFDLIQREIFEKSSDIDMLFVGSSTLRHAVNVPQIQAELSRIIGRQATAVVLPYNYRCELFEYLALRDLLARRRVKMVVMMMPHRLEQYGTPHLRTHYWMLYGDESFRGLPLHLKASLYASTVLGAPRRLLSLLRKDELEWSKLSDHLGTELRETGLRGSIDPAWHAKPLQLAASSMIYSAQTRDKFDFYHQPLTWFQDFFVRRRIKLLQEHRVPVVFLSVPDSENRRDTAVMEREYWPEYFGADIPMIGIPPAALFAGMTDEEIDQLFYDEDHFNRNGNELFSRSIEPALMELYQRYEQRQN
jgi:hypothetical protein